MTYSGGQRGKAKPRSERESPLQSLLGMMLPSGTGRPAMDRRTATQKYADAVATEQMTPLERAPVGTPMVLGGELGYKGIKQSGEFKGAPTWIKRQDMESENIPTYDSSTQQYIYATRGNNTNTFWRYDTYSDEWSVESAVEFGAPSDSFTNNIH